MEYLQVTVDSLDASGAGGTLKGGDLFTLALVDLPANQLKYSWPKFYWNFKNPEIVGLRVVNVEIPVVYTPFEYGTFVYSISGQDYTITIEGPAINSLSTLATYIADAVNLITPGFQSFYDFANDRMTYEQSISALPWSLSFSPTSLYAQMGFPADSTFSAAGVGVQIISPGAPSLFPTSLYLNSSKLGTVVEFNMTDTFSARNGQAAIFKIPVDTFTPVVLYDNPNNRFFYDYDGSIDQFDLYLTRSNDALQLPIDMKGVSWSVTFELMAREKTTLGKRVRGVSTIQ